MSIWRRNMIRLSIWSAMVASGLAILIGLLRRQPQRVVIQDRRA